MAGSHALEKPGQLGSHGHHWASPGPPGHIQVLSTAKCPWDAVEEAENPLDLPGSPGETCVWLIIEPTTFQGSFNLLEGGFRWQVVETGKEKRGQIVLLFAHGITFGNNFHPHLFGLLGAGLMITYRRRLRHNPLLPLTETMHFI